MIPGGRDVVLPQYHHIRRALLSSDAATGANMMVSCETSRNHTIFRYRIPFRDESMNHLPNRTVVSSVHRARNCPSSLTQPDMHLLLPLTKCDASQCNPRSVSPNFQMFIMLCTYVFSPCKNDIHDKKNDPHVQTLGTTKIFILTNLQTVTICTW